MHTRFILVLASVALATGLAWAQQGAELSQHVFFKHFIGNWEAEGDLTGADGNIVKVKEEWTGTATTEGQLVMEGKRQINDTKQSFRWSITRNAATDSFRGELVTDGDEAGKLQFEVNVSEVNLTAELKAPLGASGSVTLVDSFPMEDKNTISSQVTLLGDGGETNLSGTITHKRVKGD